MDYEKVHEAAITLGRELIKKNPELKDWAVRMLPELQTSEEQELIDKIIGFILKVRTDEHWTVGNWSDDAIEWLKTKRETAGQPLEQRKFKIGDYVVGKFLRGRVTAITDDAYLLDTEMRFAFTEEDNVHLWSVDDCQTGDIITTDDCPIVILFKEWDDISEGSAFAYAGIDTNGGLQITDKNDGYWTLEENIRIATRKESDALKTMLLDAGYEWNKTSLSLEKIQNHDKLTAGIVTEEESLGISSDEFNEIAGKCLYEDVEDPCVICKQPKLNCHNFPCFRKENYIKNCNNKPINAAWHTLEETPEYPCDILFVSNVENVFLYRYIEDGRPVDRETPYFHNLIDGKWCYCKDIISKEPQHIWSKEAVISALTDELNRRIQTLSEKSLNETEYGCLNGLVELRSYVNSPEFKISAESRKTAWTPYDDTMLIYTRKYLDDMLHATDSEEAKQNIKDAMNWLSDIKIANKKTGNINVDEMVSERSRKYTETHKELNLYRKGIEDTLKKLKIE